MKAIGIILSVIVYLLIAFIPVSALLEYIYRSNPYIAIPCYIYCMLSTSFIGIYFANKFSKWFKSNI